jgi:hypothetical protein
MRVTLLGVLGFVAVVVLIGYVLHEWQRTAQKNEPPQPNLPPGTL